MNEQQEQDVAELNRHAEYYTSHHPNSDVGILLRRFLTHVKELEQKRDAALKLAQSWLEALYFLPPDSAGKPYIGTAYRKCARELRSIFAPKGGK